MCTVRYDIAQIHNIVRYKHTKERNEDILLNSLDRQLVTMATTMPGVHHYINKSVN